jgi:hypothetical protein
MYFLYFVFSLDIRNDNYIYNYIYNDEICKEKI